LNANFLRMQRMASAPSVPSVRPSPQSDFNALEAHLSNLAVRHNINGSLNPALDALVMLRNERPYDSNVWSDMGAVLQQMRRLRESAEHLEHAIALNPDNHVAMNNLGVTLKDLEQPHEALAWFLRAGDGGQLSAIENAANIYRDAGDFRSAFDLICTNLFGSEACGSDAESIGVACVLALAEGVADSKGDREKVKSSWGQGVVEMVAMLATKDPSGKLTTGMLTFMSWSGLFSFQAVEGIYDVLRSDKAGDGDYSVHLVVQFFHNSENEIKTVESLAALSANLRNPFFSRVHVMLEREEDLEVLKRNLDVEVGVDSVFEGKLLARVTNERLTFAAAFEYINRELKDDEVGLLANSDILFGPSLEFLAKRGVDRGSVYALTRWELQGQMKADGWKDRAELARQLDGAYLQPRIDSQDAWAVRGGGSVPELVLKHSGFWQGLPRCDGRIARLFEDAGWKVLNACMDIRGIHLEGLFGERSAVQEPRELGYDMSKNVVGETSSVKIMM